MGTGGRACGCHAHAARFRRRMPALSAWLRCPRCLWWLVLILHPALPTPTPPPLPQGPGGEPHLRLRLPAPAQGTGGVGGLHGAGGGGPLRGCGLLWWTTHGGVGVSALWCLPGGSAEGQGCQPAWHLAGALPSTHPAPGSATCQRALHTQPPTLPATPATPLVAHPPTLAPPHPTLPSGSPGQEIGGGGEACLHPPGPAGGCLSQPPRGHDPPLPQAGLRPGAATGAHPGLGRGLGHPSPPTTCWGGRLAGLKCRVSPGAWGGLAACMLGGLLCWPLVEGCPGCSAATRCFLLHHPVCTPPHLPDLGSHPPPHPRPCLHHPCRTTAPPRPPAPTPPWPALAGSRRCMGCGRGRAYPPRPSCARGWGRRTRCRWEGGLCPSWGGRAHPALPSCSCQPSRRWPPWVVVVGHQAEGSSVFLFPSLSLQCSVDSLFAPPLRCWAPSLHTACLRPWAPLPSRH